MSRAFVRESEAEAASVRPEPDLPPGAPNRTTPAGVRAFRERLAAQVAARAGLATDGVDGARRAELDAEIRWLERRMSTFVETPCPENPVRVSFGTEVEVQSDAGVRIVRIVGADEVDPSRGAISWLAPLARALMGAEEGDDVVVTTPSGTDTVAVVAVRALSRGEAGR